MRRTPIQRALPWSAVVPVSGLVLTLSPEPSIREAVLVELRSRPEVEIGDLQGPRLPIVIDTPRRSDDLSAWEWLRELPGVLFVDLVCTDWSSDGPDSPECAVRIHRRANGVEP